MTAPLLTAKRLRELLHYDPDTGLFTWLVSPSQGVVAGDAAGSVDRRGYVVIGYQNRIYRAHRLAWLYVHGEWPARGLDHRDEVKSNNRIANLREATHAQNSQNHSAPRRHSGTGFLGVTYDRVKRKFKADIQVDGKKHHVGRFDTAEAAHAAYINAKRELHPFGRL